MKSVKVKIIGAAALLASASQPIAAQPAQSYPCDRITADLIELYNGFGAPSATSGAAVMIANGAQIFASDIPVAFTRYRAEGTGLALKKPVVFRSYIVAGENRYCTPSADNRLFGKGDTKKRFKLRCLIDDDGDGMYEAAMPYGPYVRINPVTGAVVTTPQPPAARIDLPNPVTLTLDANVPLRKASHQSFINMRVHIGAVEGDLAEIFADSAVNVTPDEPGYELVGSRETVLARLIDGSEFEAGGARMIIRQSTDKKGNPIWTAQVTNYPAVQADLQCGGKVVALPKTATVITAETQYVSAR